MEERSIEGKAAHDRERDCGIVCAGEGARVL